MPVQRTNGSKFIPGLGRQLKLLQRLNKNSNIATKARASTAVFCPEIDRLVNKNHNKVTIAVNRLVNAAGGEPSVRDSTKLTLNEYGAHDTMGSLLEGVNTPKSFSEIGQDGSKEKFRTKLSGIGEGESPGGPA
jgi:hypothetical protein